MRKYGKPNQFGMVPILPDKLKDLKKGDKRFIWYKGDVREVEVRNTYNHKNGICIYYSTKTTCGTDWVDKSRLFISKEKCVKEHLRQVQDKQKKEIKKITEKDLEEKK